MQWFMVFILTKLVCRTLQYIWYIFFSPNGVGGCTLYSLRKISFFMVSASDLKYKLTRHETFNQLLFWIAPGLISCIFIWNHLFSEVHFFSVSITFFLFEHYQLWTMDSKAQMVFFAKTPKMCVWHTEVSNCNNFQLGRSFSTVSPKMGSAG